VLGWFPTDGIVIATLAAVISQALISGSFYFNQLNEVNFWPKLK
jgi:K+ transporter